MTTIRLQSALGLIILSGVAAAARGQASLQYIPMPSGTTQPEAWTISSDGSTVVGTAVTGGQLPWYWRIGPAPATLVPPSPDVNTTYGVGVSGNGGAMTWASWNNSARSRKFNTMTNSFEDFPLVNGMQYPHLVCVSADGTFFGGCLIDQGHDRHIGGWSSSSGTVYPPSADGALDQGYVRAASADGHVLVGAARSSANNLQEAFRSSESEGTNIGLGSFDPIMFYQPYSGAIGVSADGSVVVGWALSGGVPTPFRWTAQDGLVNLGHPGQGEAGEATAVSADGNTVIGHATVGLAGAFIWTPESGMRDLRSVLIERGATGLDGVNLITAHSISPDGTIIVGGAHDASGNPRAYIARLNAIGCYTNCDGSTAPPVLNANDFQCFLNLFAIGDPRANCDGSTVSPTLNANDFQCFIVHFAAGC